MASPPSHAYTTDFCGVRIAGDAVWRCYSNLASVTYCDSRCTGGGTLQRLYDSPNHTGCTPG